MTFGQLKQPNILILMSDQERAIQHFPETWVQSHLPTLNKLKQQGMTFNNAIVNTTPCSPAIATLFTGLYPAINGLSRVGRNLEPTSINLTHILSNVLKTAGYEVAYKGKWHLIHEFNKLALKIPRLVEPTLEQQQQLQAADAEILNTWQFNGWTAPDAGTSITDSKAGLETLGGSIANNDGRIVNGPNLLSNQQSVLEFLAEHQQPKQPFCLIVSLINPHDISYFKVVNEGRTAYPLTFKNYPDFQLPESYYTDNLMTKPWIQNNCLALMRGKLNEKNALNYVKFYAYLQTLIDGYYGQILNAMSDSLLENTLIIRLSDHGEMAMAHNGLSEKFNQVYRETLNIPLIFSNPILYPQGVEVDHLVGVVDILPTLATIAGLKADERQQFDFQGIDFSKTLLDPSHPTQESVLFTFDDHFISTAYPPPGDAHHIRCLQTIDRKYAVYYGLNDEDEVILSSLQYELYNLKDDPLEITNLLPVNGITSSEAKIEQNRLHQKLTEKLQHTQTLQKIGPPLSK